jgi:hypothetical protein
MKKLILTIIIFITVINFTFSLTEAEIYNERSKRFSLYSLSNDVDEIENAILARAARVVNLSDIGWDLSPNISANVKATMIKLDMNFAMTTYSGFGLSRIIIVYRRVEDLWFTCYCILNE